MVNLKTAATLLQKTKKFEKFILPKAIGAKTAENPVLNLIAGEEGEQVSRISQPRPRRKSYLEYVLENEIYKERGVRSGSKKISKKVNKKVKRRRKSNKDC